MISVMLRREAGSRVPRVPRASVVGRDAVALLILVATFPIAIVGLVWLACWLGIR